MIEFLNEYRSIIHLFLHVLVPSLAAWVLVRFTGFSFWKILLILVATMAVDADHLVADPIYAPNRCSIFFHPLHTLWPMVVYGLMTLWPVSLVFRNASITRRDELIGLVGLGLVIHMMLDYSDCVWMKGW